MAAFVLLSTPGLRAQDVERVAEREIARRQAALPQGNEALTRAQLAMQSKDYARAHEEYRTAVAYLPDAVVSGNAREQAVEGYCESGVKLAQIRVQEGKFVEAEAICRDVLSTRYNPNYRPAALLLASLKEPG
ncbi:MAG TPA: hypothetical protein VF551_05020, partial [Chthoniobacterales bacterium]